MRSNSWWRKQEDPNCTEQEQAKRPKITSLTVVYNNSSRRGMCSCGLIHLHFSLNLLSGAVFDAQHPVTFEPEPPKCKRHSYTCHSMSRYVMLSIVITTEFSCQNTDSEFWRGNPSCETKTDKFLGAIVGVIFLGNPSWHCRFGKYSKNFDTYFNTPHVFCTSHTWLVEIAQRSRPFSVNIFEVYC